MGADVNIRAIVDEPPLQTDSGWTIEFHFSDNKMDVTTDKK